MKPSVQRVLFLIPWLVSFALFSTYPILFSISRTPYVDYALTAMVTPDLVA